MNQSLSDLRKLYSKINNQIIEQMKNKEIYKKLEGIGVEVLNEEHGKEVIETFKALGVDTRAMSGILTKEDGDLLRFYGTDGGCFDYNNKGSFTKIITLEELKQYLPNKGYNLPQTMWVWDDDESEKGKCYVFNIDKNRQFPILCFESELAYLTEEASMSYKNCAPIELETKTIEGLKAYYESKEGVEVELINSK